MYNIYYNVPIMNRKKYKRLRVIVAFFVSALVSVAVSINSYFLSIATVLTGMIFMALVRSKVKIQIDEREKTVQEKAAQMTYAIFAPTIGLGSFLLLMFSSGAMSAAKGEFYYLESLGMVFAYLTLFLIAIYAISYYFLNRKYGGDDDEK